MKIIKVAVMPKEMMKEYTMKIARGEVKPKQGAPKIFFPTMRAMSEALPAKIVNWITHHP